MPKKEKNVLKLFANIFELRPETPSAVAASRSAASVTFGDEIDDALPDSSSSRILVARRRIPSRGDKDDVIAKYATSCTEYVRLFGVSRAGQTDDQCVGKVKNAEKDFADLMSSLQQSRESLDDSYTVNVRSANRVLAAYVEARIGHLHHMHDRAVDRVRRACRGQYADAVARLMQDAQRYRDNSIATLVEDHHARMSGMHAHIFAVKREARRRADIISKLRSKVARGQVVLKKHGFLDSETNQCITDERLRGEDTMGHLQTLLYEKEEKIADLAERVLHMEAAMEERAPQKAGGYPARPVNSGSANRQTGRRISVRYQRPDRRLSLRESAMGPSMASSIIGGASSVTASEPPSVSTSRSGTPEPPEVLLENLLADVTTLYESRLEQMRATHAARMEAIVRDQEQNTIDLEKQYNNAKRSLNGAEGIHEQIRGAMVGEGAIRDIVRKLFPRGPKPGCVDASVQCNLDPFTS
ncbi:hypothetical protein DFJ77DRAFT_23144 [Powellomyces hirtus]|nr:hypothetical protein DFJ77DRAFT_23144 [Powellomyces hirtus]